MRLPGAALAATIRLKARRWAHPHRQADGPPQAAADTGAASDLEPANTSAITTAPDAAVAQSDPASAAPALAKEKSSAQERWASLARRRHLPPLVRKYVQYRWTVTLAQASERHMSRRDPAENRETRIPDEEQIRVPVIWLTELYTPTTLAALLQGLPPLLAKARYQHPDRGDLVDWVQAARRQGGGAWRALPIVRPPGSRHNVDDIVDDLPDSFTSVTWGIYTLTSTVTAVTAAFHVQEHDAQELQRIINRDVSTRAILTPGGGYKISDVRWQKEESANGWRESLRVAAATWLADRLPGSFHSLVPGQPPTIELLLTEKQRPWEEPPPSEKPKRDWTQLLDLEDWEGYWQSTDMPWLRLHERQIPRWNPSQRHILTFAALRPEFLATITTTEDGASALNQAIYQFHLYVVPFANRQALTALLSELDEQLAAMRDLSERATSQRSPKALTQVQRQLITTGLNGQIVAADITRFAQNEIWWQHDVLDFTKITPSALIPYVTPGLPLAESLRQGQINHGTAIAQAEADLRDLINSSAQLTAATENIRLQRSVRWLAVISLIVAIIAAAATIAALQIASRSPASTPTTHPSSART
jgi:hypothetical protein